MEGWKCCFCGNQLAVIIATSRTPHICLGQMHDPLGGRHVMCDRCEMWIRFTKLPVATTITKEIQEAMFHARPPEG